MRVLVIPTWYPSGEDKLMGIYHKEFTCALNKYGIDADMLFVDRQRLKSPLKYMFMKKNVVIKENNYEVHIRNMLNLRPISFDLQMNYYTKVLEKAFNRYLNSHPKPDVLHAQVTVPAGYATVKLGEKYNIPVVITEHGGLLERFFKDEPYKKYGLYALEHSYYSTVSNYMKDIVSKYSKDCTVLPNEVDTHLFENIPSRELDGTFRLITVCAIREGKRLDIAFEALKILKDKKFDVHLDIIGDGFYESIFKESAKKIGVDDMVTFHGRKEKEELPKYMADAHALLISSEIESFAIPGIEAMASGIPVISTDCLGPRDFVTNKTGLLVPVNDPKTLAKAIEKLKKDYKKYKDNDLRAMAESFSEKEVVKKAKKLYEKAIKKGMRRMKK